MSLPIILAIVLTAAILAWGAAYLVVRQRREAALKKMFQADPMDAEIGREALRRVFGILADEDPPTPLPVGKVVVPAPAPAPATVAPLPPVALGPAGVKLGSAGRSAAVAPATLAKPVSLAPLTVAASMGSGSATAGIIKPGFRLFAPDDTNAAAMAATATPLLAQPALAASVAAPAKPVVVTHVVSDVSVGSSGRAGRLTGVGRPRFLRDRLSVLLVTGGIVVLLVAVFDPRLSILTGGVLPATATAPAIARVSPTPSPSPSPVFVFVPVATPSDPPSPSLSPSPSPSADPTPVITPKPTPKPTPVPTPFPTPTPKPTGTPKPTPTPAPPVVLSLTALPSTVNTGDVVSFSGSFINAHSWTIYFGDGLSCSGSRSGNGAGPATCTHMYSGIGTFSPYMVAKTSAGVSSSPNYALPVNVN